MFDPESLEHARVRELWDHWVREKVPLIAPSLLRYEVTNAFFRSVRTGEKDAAKSIAIIKSLESFPILYFDSVDLNVSAFSIANILRLGAAYDAHYIALAIQEGALFYTADKRLANAATIRYPFVRYVMVEDISPD